MNKKYFAAAALACALMSCGTGKNSVAVVDFYRGMEYCRSERRKGECGKCTILGL